MPTYTYKSSSGKRKIYKGPHTRSYSRYARSARPYKRISRRKRLFKRVMSKRRVKSLFVPRKRYVNKKMKRFFDVPGIGKALIPALSNTSRLTHVESSYIESKSGSMAIAASDANGSASAQTATPCILNGYDLNLICPTTVFQSGHTRLLDWHLRWDITNSSNVGAHFTIYKMRPRQVLPQTNTPSAVWVTGINANQSAVVYTASTMPPHNTPFDYPGFVRQYKVLKTENVFLQPGATRTFVYKSSKDRIIRLADSIAYDFSNTTYWFFPKYTVKWVIALHGQPASETATATNIGTGIVKLDSVWSTVYNYGAYIAAQYPNVETNFLPTGTHSLFPENNPISSVEAKL